ncbi:PREDICTED: accelerated cell death 11-like [Nelumbo nucifera]|uniref:Accelerated cell death 11-like n=1 Tax=Nelumbo nucifera TaxID=4432 RepID=A0A1U8Q844_NELNU|nr:PREDICTED: accelerated cell death 11-like [Nelumbo nucifera]
MYPLFSECSLREAASTAYPQVFAQYHTWAIRTAVGAGLYTLPTREQLVVKLNETNGRPSILHYCCRPLSKEGNEKAISLALAPYLQFVWPAVNMRKNLQVV